MMNQDFEEEIQVLQSIYDVNVSVQNVSDAGDIAGQVIYRDEKGIFTIFIDVPRGYPAVVPVVSISCSTKHAQIKGSAIQSVESVLAGSVGSVVLFSLIEAVKEKFADVAVQDDGADQEAEHAEEFDIAGLGSDVEDENGVRTMIGISLEVIHGPVTTEQKSAFQAHFAIVTSMNEVNLFKEIVYEDKKVARATHNIFAYRFTCPTTGVVYHDQDDDGETAAGGRLAEMVRLMKADNVAVIVSRWFGGILLGPDRFKFICNSARDLLEEHGIGKQAMGTVVAKKPNTSQTGNHCKKR